MSCFSSEVADTVHGERFPGLNIHGSVPLKFLQIYFRIALAISAHYLAQLKRGGYIHRKTFTVLLKP